MFNVLTFCLKIILGTGIGKSGTETCIEQSFWKAKSSEIYCLETYRYTVDKS